LIYIVYALHVITCIFLIMVVLLQQGKGADLSVFGGGSTQAAFGARGAATILHKLTVAFFILFMITTVSIGVLQRGRRASSVMSGVSTKSQPASAPAPPPAAPPAAAPAGPAEAAPQGAAPAPAGDASNGAANGAAAPQSQAPAAPPSQAAPQSQAPVAPASGNAAGSAPPASAPPSSNP
jgi:preprotein translocase subunit SecG